MPSVEILAVGTELLLGQLVDTNTAFIAAQMAENGIDVYATHAVGDNRERIAARIRASLAQTDGVITSGGLGPTVDDVTKEAVCDALGVEPEMNEAALGFIEERFAFMGRVMRENNRKQALLPRGALVLENPNGTAPGFVAVNGDGKFVASMPGVPGEMKPMLAERLLPWLRERLHVTSSITTRVLKTIGMAESEIDHRIGDLFAAYENPKIGVLAHGGRCDVKMMAKASSAAEAAALIAPLEAQLRERLGPVVFGADDDTLESVVARDLIACGETVALAESCTGGLVAATLARVPGVSQTLLGGVVAYDNSVKIALLNVPAAILEAHGAVSAEVAAAMASGARERFGSTVAVSVTGVAGPSGGTDEKPAGLVWFGVAEQAGVYTRKSQFPGSRERVQQAAALTALALLWKRRGLEPTAPGIT